MKASWSVSDEVISAFHLSTKAQRQRLLNAFNKITEFPANHEEYTELGRDGRLYSVARVSSWEFTYWIDSDHEVVHFVDTQRIS
jgi:hypothetical protein